MAKRVVVKEAEFIPAMYKMQMINDIKSAIELFESYGESINPEEQQEAKEVIISMINAKLGAAKKLSDVIEVSRQLESCRDKKFLMQSMGVALISYLKCAQAQQKIFEALAFFSHYSPITLRDQLRLKLNPDNQFDWPVIEEMARKELCQALKKWDIEFLNPNNFKKIF